MRKLVIPALAGLIITVLAAVACAGSEPDSDCNSTSSSDSSSAPVAGCSSDSGSKASTDAGPVTSADAPKSLRESLQKAFPGNPVTDIRKTPIKGMYEVSIGSEIGYVSEDGKYLLHGDLLDIGTQKNLTEERRQTSRTKLLAQFGEKDMIVFSPKMPKHTVTVFTDIDCGYCRMMHKEMQGYGEQGIAVRYLFFPRAGMNSDSSRKADAVWCAKDRRDALTRSKNGETIPPGSCKTPVASHYQAGLSIGVRGTPAIVTEDGRIIPGYQPPAQLLQTLENPG